MWIWVPGVHIAETNIYLPSVTVSGFLDQVKSFSSSSAFIIIWSLTWLDPTLHGLCLALFIPGSQPPLFCFKVALKLKWWDKQGSETPCSLPTSLCHNRNNCNCTLRTVITEIIAIVLLEHLARLLLREDFTKWTTMSYCNIFPVENELFRHTFVK